MGSVAEDAVASQGVQSPVDRLFQRYDQDQSMLLAPDIRDWLGADYPAR
jgi:hypothetical protein